MKKTILYSVTLLILLLSACVKEEVLPETTLENETGQTITLSATFPGEEPTTKVALDHQQDRSISLTWEDGDQLQLAFVKEGKTTVKQTVTIRDITPNGKKAQFDITLPTGFDSGTFDLYGVYGGGGIDITGANPVAVLPSNAGSATSLNDHGGSGILDPNSVQARRDVMLYFSSKGIDATAPNVSVNFIHLGSLFCINLYNQTNTDLLFNSAKLVGVDGTTGDPLVGGSWAYNSANGGKTYDLVNGEFQDQNSGSNYISFTPSQTTIPARESISLWAWYPPLPSVNWPALKLTLNDSNDQQISQSINWKGARTSPTATGKCFYFEAGYMSDLEMGEFIFIFEPAPPPSEYHVETMGTLNSVINNSGDDPSQIGALKITGQINADDFAFMKNNMPNLYFIDIAEVTCDGDSIPTRAFNGVETGSNIHERIQMVFLPNSITKIGVAAFANCTKIGGIFTLPSNLITIEKDAFMGCYNIQNIEFNNALENIGQNAFLDCDHLVDIYTNTSQELVQGFPTGLITIGADAFANCKEIQTPITFSSTLTSIGAFAFRGCTSIPSFTFNHASVFPYAEKMFWDAWPINAVMTTPIYVEQSLVATYKASPGWTDHEVYISAPPAP